MILVGLNNNSRCDWRFSPKLVNVGESTGPKMGCANNTFGELQGKMVSDLRIHFCAQFASPSA